MDPLLNCVKEEQEFYSSQETLVYGNGNAVGGTISNKKDEENRKSTKIRVKVEEEQEEETTPLLFNSSTTTTTTTTHRKKRKSGCRWCIISVVVLLLITLGALLLTMFVFIPNAKKEEITQSISNLFLDRNSTSLSVITVRQDEVVFSMDSLFFQSDRAEGVELKELYVEYNSTRIGGIVSVEEAEDGVYVLNIQNHDWLGLYLRDLLLFQQEHYENSLSTLKLHYSLEFEYNFVFPLKQQMEFQRVHTMKPAQDLLQSTFQRFNIYTNYTFTIELLLSSQSTSQLFKEVNLSQYTFQMIYKDIVIGLFTIDNFRIQFPNGADYVVVGRGELILPSFGSNDYHYRDLFSEFMSRVQNGVEWNDFKLEIKSYSSSSSKEVLGGSHLPPIARVFWLEEGLAGYRREIQYRDQRPNGHAELIRLTQFSVEKFNLKIRRLYDYAPVLNGIFRFHVNDSIVQFNVVKTRYRIRLYKQLHGDKRVLLGYTETQYDNAINSHSNDSTVVTARFNIPSKDDYYLKVVSVQDYQRFVSDIVQYSQIGLFIEGNVDFIVQYQRNHHEKDVAEYEVRNIPFSSQVELEGMALDEDKDNFENGEYFYFEDSPVIRDQVDIGGDLSVQLDGYMKVIGEKHQTGWQLLSSVDFHVEYGDCGHDNDNDQLANSTVVGVMKLDSIDLSGAGCVAISSKNDSEYCTIFPSLLFSLPPDEILCEDCTDGHGRQFMSALLFKDHFNVSLKAIHTESPDFREALKYFQFQNVSLKGYTPRNITIEDQKDEPKSDDKDDDKKKEEVEQQFQLVRRIIVQPSTTILFGQLNAWIDFYNPFELNFRYYYLNLGLYLNDKIIGRIQVNFTDYDPFMFSKNTYIPRAMQSKRDPYGPHPSQLCLNPGDCQISPIDVRTANEVKAINATKSKEEWEKEFKLIPRMDTGCVRSDRMTLNLRLADAYVLKFWKYLTEKEDVKFNVTLKGKVAVGMGTQFYNNTKRTTTMDCPERKVPDGYMQERSSIRDPYCYPDRPKDENVNVMWLDYEQELTEVEIKKAGQKPPTIQGEDLVGN